MAMTEAEARQNFEKLLSKKHGLLSTDALYASMADKFVEKFNATPEADRDAFVKSMETVDGGRPSVYNLWETLPVRYSTFINAAASEYNSGYDVDAIAFMNREKAAVRNDVTFLDPHTVRKNKTLDEDLNVQSGKDKKFLLTGAASVLAASNTSNDLKAFLNVLQKKGHLADYEKLIVPLSCQDEPGITGVGHAITLVWDIKKNEAMIIDQCGGDSSYPKSKEEVKNILAGLGVTNVSYNQDSLTGQNRSDCACVSSMVVNDILAGKEFGDFTAQCYGNDNDNSKIDSNHENDQKLLLQALFNIHKNSPVFQIYCEAKGIDFDRLSDDEKKKAIDGFKLFKDAGDFSLGDRTQDSPNNDFIAVIKPYVEEVLAEHPKRQFTQYQDTEYPNALAYKHEDGSKFIITSETSAQIESKTLEDHMILCEYAKNMGCKNMDFGPYFKTHLDEAALLYLAALKTGMGVKNAPDIEKFKELPQYDEIKLRLKVQNELKDLQEKKEALANDENYKMQKEKMRAHVGDFKTFLNSNSPQQQSWVDLTKANDEAKAAREVLKNGLDAATPEEKALFDKVRAEQYKNKADGKTETVTEIMNRLVGQGQQVDSTLVGKVENLVTLQENVDASRAKVLAASAAFKAEIPNITAPGAKEYCEAWVAAQANPVYRAFRDAEAGYKGRINAAFDEYLSNCTPEQRVDRIASLKEGMSGQKLTEAELTQLKENSYQSDGQKAQDKQKENIVQTIYTHSYRGK